MSRLDLSSLTVGELDAAQRAVLEARARSLGARIQARRRVRHGGWKVVVSGADRQIMLNGYGSLEAVICGALDDWSAA